MSGLAARLRAALAATAASAEPSWDVAGHAPRVAVAAAVLVTVVERPAPTLLLTQRTTTLRRHAGQVAFPGGRADPEDADAVATALREAQEEIGLDPALVEVVGLGARHRTITGFEITPVVGVVPPALDLVPHEAEVAALFEVPLAFAIDPANHEAREVAWEGEARRYIEMHWEGRRIWGATAAMIAAFGRRIAPAFA